MNAHAHTLALIAAVDAMLAGGQGNTAWLVRFRGNLIKFANDTEGAK